jgi:putative glycosyltransferase
MMLSIVTTLYRSERFVETFLHKAVKAGEVFGGDFEIVVVDDGSPDGSRRLAERYADSDRRVRVIELARNFGHHSAFMCGMRYANGDYCFLIDSDLEVDPAELRTFQRTMEASSADVVYGVQETRRGAVRTRVLGGLFWRLFSICSEIDVPADIMTERLMNRRYLDALLSMGDRNVFLGGMFYWPGFLQVPVKLVKSPRHGAGSYSLLRRVELFVEAVSSFSSAPLKLIFWLGIGISGPCMLYFVYLLLRRLLLPESIVDGFTFLALVSVANLGLLLIGLGIIGLYIHRVFRQVQGRPVFVVKNIYSQTQHGGLPDHGRPRSIR